MYSKNIVFLASLAVLFVVSYGLENPYWRYVKNTEMPIRTYYRYPMSFEMPYYSYYTRNSYPEWFSNMVPSIKPTSSIQLPLSYTDGLTYPLRYAYPYASAKYASPALLKEIEKGESGYIRRFSSVLTPTKDIVTPMPLFLSETSTKAPLIESSSALPLPIIAEQLPAMALPREKLQDEVVGPSGYIATFSEKKK